METASQSSTASCSEEYPESLGILPPAVSTSQIKEDLHRALQRERAAEAFYLAKHRESRSKIAEITKALEALGDIPDRVRTRSEALRDYMVDHPDERVTTKEIRSNPCKYGIVTSSSKLQLNWLHGRRNPTARKFFVVTRGDVRLRPGITKETPPCG